MDKLFRKLPVFKGKQRLARLLFANAIKKRENIIVKGNHDCTYLLPNILENVGFDIFINGEYEPEIQLLINRLLPPNACFFDLGANIGSIVIPTAKRRPDISAVAIEAAPWVFAYLQENISKNKLKNIHLFNNALFSEDNKDLDFFSPQDKFGKGSLAPVFTNKGISVRTKKIDTIVKELNFDRVNLIKIDVEGFEYFVFKGALELLNSSGAPVIIFEFVDWAEKQAMNLEPGSAQRFLIDLGYTLYEIQGNNLVRMEKPFNSGSYNLLASKNELKFYENL